MKHQISLIHISAFGGWKKRTDRSQ